jgi:hypothetical protein
MSNGRMLSNKGVSRAYLAQRQILYLTMMRAITTKMASNTKTFEFKQSEEVNANLFFLKKL